MATVERFSPPASAASGGGAEIESAGRLNGQFTRPRRPHDLPPTKPFLPPRVGFNAGFGGGSISLPRAKAHIHSV
jgi:hypothetical protein